MTSVVSPCPCKRRLMQIPRRRFRCVAEDLVRARAAGAHRWEGSVHKHQAQKTCERVGWCSLDRRSPDHSDNLDRKTSCFLAAVLSRQPLPAKSSQVWGWRWHHCFLPELDACKEEMQGISNLERQVLLSGSKPLMHSLVEPCTKSCTLPTTTSEKWPLPAKPKLTNLANLQLLPTSSPAPASVAASNPCGYPFTFHRGEPLHIISKLIRKH